MSIDSAERAKIQAQFGERPGIAQLVEQAASQYATGREHGNTTMMEAGAKIMDQHGYTSDAQRRQAGEERKAAAKAAKTADTGDESDRGPAPTGSGTRTRTTRASS